MVSKKEAAESVRAAKARLGVTWGQLAEAVGRPLGCAAWGLRVTAPMPS